MAETEKEYKKNTKQLNENIKGLNGQKSAIGSLMTSKKAEIQALESANAGLNKNSQAYKDGVFAVISKWIIVIFSFTHMVSECVIWITF